MLPVGHTPIPPRRPKAAAQQVRDQFVRGERDLAGLERGLAWLFLHGLDETFQTIGAHWPPEELGSEPAERTLDDVVATMGPVPARDPGKPRVYA